MTREEAIKGLETLSKYFSGYKPNEEMFEMAVSALKAQDATDTNVGSNGDTIYRQMAIDALMEILDRPNHAEFLYTDEICRALGQLSSAQPEVIRCKDCVHWDTSWQNDYAPNYHYCPMVDGTRKDDFYCADAERRTDG